ncbi:MAG: two-component regulator propeller domain-containing protein [Acidobacteriota bacterium]
MQAASTDSMATNQKAFGAFRRGGPGDLAPRRRSHRRGLIGALAYVASALLGASAEAQFPTASSLTGQDGSEPSPSPATAAVAPNELAPTRVFREFSKRTAPGLPQSTILDMHQDRKGLLWLATFDGVGLYDGVEVKPLPRTPGAPVDGAVLSITEGRSGEVLVGGTKSIHSFDGEAWSIRDAPGMSFNLTEDADGRLLRVDGTGAWLRSVEDDDDAWSPLELGELGSADEVLGPGVAIQRGEGDRLWVAGRRGVATRLDGRFEQLPGVSALLSAMLATDVGVFVATRNGELLRLPPGGERFSPVPISGWNGGWIRTLEIDRRGRLWAGGNRGGVAVSDPQAGFGDGLETWDLDQGFVRGGLLDILADREGTVWFSINGRGAAQWLGESWTHRTVWGPDPLDPRLQVFGLRPAAQDGSFYAAVFGRGIWHWDGAEMTEIPEGPFEDARVAFEVDPGTLWIGARFGAWRRDAAGEFERLFGLENGFVWDFERGPDGRWWAATSTAGLYVEGDGGWTPAPENANLPDLAVRDVMWRGDELWVGTMSGAAVFRGGESVRPEVGDALPQAINGFLAVDDAVWMVGVGGVTVWREQGLRHYRPQDGLPGSTIYSVARGANGQIWIGGSSGVARLDGERWRVYGTGDGLIESETNHQALLPLDDGSVLVGTMASLARYGGGLPDLDVPELHLAWTSRPRGTLGTDNRSVRLEWRAPWLTERPVEYRVRVPRLSAEWSSPRRERFMQLDSLGPGGWRAEVAARFVGEPEWGDSIVAGWEVAPRWFETRFFGLFCALLGLGAVASVVRWRTAHLRRRAQKLQESVDEAVAELKVLGGLLPICSVCKKIRDDDGYWQQIERYVDQHSEAVFSHGLCPSCADEHYGEYVKGGVGAGACDCTDPTTDATPSGGEKTPSTAP